MEKKAGAVRMLEKEDYTRKNAFGYPVVGWRRTSQGFESIFNPRGFSCLRVVQQKNTGGEMIDLYDQVFMIENPGSFLVITTSDSRIALTREFRMVGPRLIEGIDIADYLNSINSQEKWDELLSTLGQWLWQVPRGIAVTEGKNLDEVFLQTAKIESQEEAGIRIINPRVIGEFNWNPTFCAHAQAVVKAHVEFQGEATPEDLENISGLKFVSPQEIREMTRNGEITDGPTLAALAIAGVNFSGYQII